MHKALLLVIFIGIASCSSLPPPPVSDNTGPAESGYVPLDNPVDNQAGNPEALAESQAPAGTGEEEAVAEEADTEDDRADIQKRAEEMLAYLDTPVNPDLPEPYYLIPESEPEVDDAVADAGANAEDIPDLDESSEPAPSPAELADGAEIPGPSDLEEPAEPLTEIADGNDSTEGEADIPGQAETAAVEKVPPPMPALLLPPREPAAVSPPRKPDFAILASLPSQPARVPPNETAQVNRDSPPAVRTIQAVVGELAEISFPGSGWVYLGEIDEQKGLPYQRRRVSTDGQVFVFRPETPGSYRLAFKKQDLLRGTDTDEIIEVTVIEKAVEHPKAPPEETVIAAVPVTDTKVPPEKTVSAVLPVTGTKAPPEVTAIAALPVTDTKAPPGVIPGVIEETALDQPAVVMTDSAVPAEINDVTLWNRGQEFESPGTNRNMKGALTAYKTLVRDYPQSEHYTDSQKRIAYIERFLSTFTKLQIPDPPLNP